MKRKNILFLSAATLAIIGAGAVIFNTATEKAMAAGFEQTQSIPVSYRVPSMAQTALPGAGAEQESRKKADYHVSMDDLNTDSPTDTDLTMEEAADVGMQYLETLFGLEPEGAYAYMSYTSGTETFPRAFWFGDVLFEKEQTPESTRWTYMIDAVTGELFNASYGRMLDASPSLAPDPALENNYEVYANLAREYVQRCALMESPVAAVEYNCQGYNGNDPTITVDVVGENGEVVNMSYSRYDHEFLGLITDTSLRISESAMEDLAGEAASESFTQAK